MNSIVSFGDNLTSSNTLKSIKDLASTAGTLAVDCTGADIFRVTLFENTIIGNPTNAIDGKSYIFWLTQDTAGSHTLTLASKYIVPSDATSPLGWHSTGLSMDIFAAQYDATKDKFYVVSLVGAY